MNPIDSKNILNAIKHPILGELACFTDEQGSPLKWGKLEESNLLSKQYRTILIGFDLYCYDKNYHYDTFWKDEVHHIEDDICRIYQRFLVDKESIESILFQYYIENRQAFSIENKKVNEIEALYQAVHIDEVRIYRTGYSVILSTPWEEEQIGIVRYNLFGEDAWDSVNIESEIEPVEMEYD